MEQTGALYLEKPEDVRRYSLMFDYLAGQGWRSRTQAGGIRAPGKGSKPGLS